ncbi:MAG: arginine--tRNA ligase [Neomegalonema sp.]|nr:arginine--tRNA ligase [Neomegalonema sp.]
MNLFAEIEARVNAALDAMTEAGDLPEGLPRNGVSVEPPRDPAHGDMATNAAMALAKPAKQKPRDVAEKLAAQLREAPEIESAEIAGPGFINLRLDPAAWRRVVKAALQAGAAFGRPDLPADERLKINIEYVSANPTGPLHVGHTRGAVFGDALARLLDFVGHDVTKEYYINDGGAQVDVLARSSYLRYREAHGEAIEIPEGLYPGDYLKPVGAALKEKFGDTLLEAPEDEWLATVREAATDAMMDLIREDLAALGVEMDVYFSEKSLYGGGRIEAALASLEEKGLIYEGVLEPPKGKTPEDWEPREQTLFRSTDYGDDVDRPVKKSDGSWTYFAPDIAYHYDKVERGFDELVDIFGADHGGYVKRMTAAVAALSNNRVALEIKLCQLVKLFKNGMPFTMSKRAGTFVTLRDVLAEVGPDVTRFVMLTRKNDAPLDFDFAKALEQSKDNPVYYVQYAHARICSAMREAARVLGEEAVTPEALAAAPLERLDAEPQWALAKKTAEWPRLLLSAAKAREPHRIAFYLYDLATSFHAHYNEGYENPALRFVQEADREGSQARLALACAARAAIAAGLGVLGVTPVEEMR